MKNRFYSQERAGQARTLVSGMGMAVTFVGALLLPGLALAQSEGGDFTATGETVCGFFENVNGLLNIASIAVVTIAVIFSGYQIAFNHKRVGEVATILIGGVLIGAAGQIARMLLGDEGESCGSTGADAPAGLVLFVPWLT
ncbi:TrbC/VirB2 family protein [Pseudoxanthomonas spadix]|uniref:TrbC/VirB2 family protein n=1 Tax=Pseudoxanthomonas spadix TaxID=415229 RepID=UPI000F0038ED|nr:TrbC/VirB2 family protein [Pseudoxanthomonas spadix]MBP3973844.1 TrbC/VirB2 family protein [Pseudoxanthomonas spadix]RMW95817.1 type VI secretion protein [Pseudoxanthomonas spadix]